MAERFIRDEDDPFARQYANQNLDTTTLLVHADWIQEHGYEDYAAAIRLCVETNKFPLRIHPPPIGYLAPCQWCWISGKPSDYPLIYVSRKELKKIEDYAIRNLLDYEMFNDRIFFRTLHEAVMAYASTR